MNWSDIQTLEALVRTGSIVAAARELGLQHSSLSRRIASLEAEAAAPLFLRGRRLVPTAFTRNIVALAATMAQGARAIDGLISREKRARAQTLVITTNDVWAPLLVRAIASARLSQKIEVITTDAEQVLDPGITDLALRPSARPPPSLRGVRVGRQRIGVYRAPGSDGEAWVLPSRGLRARATLSWLRGVPSDAAGRIECDSLLSMRDACVAGLGKAVLPDCLAMNDERLLRESDVAGGTAIWLLSSATARADPVLRQVTSTLVTALRAWPGIWEPAQDPPPSRSPRRRSPSR